MSLPKRSRYVLLSRQRRSACLLGKVLHVSIGQRYSVMIRLDQKPDDYILRFASFPQGDMQQIVEGQAVVSYGVSSTLSCQLDLKSNVLEGFL